MTLAGQTLNELLPLPLSFLCFLLLVMQRGNIGIGAYA